MHRNRFLPALALLALSQAAALAAPPIQALIVDGQNNHAWKETTPVLKKILEEAGFRVDVATSPAKGEDMSGFKPDFARYQVVVSNYNGAPWPAETKAAFEKYVREGGGLVSFHAADNAFPEWKGYDRGGWLGEAHHRGVRAHGPVPRRQGGARPFVGALRQPRRAPPLRGDHARPEPPDRERAPREVDARCR
jgi:hypothetical protein